jgi:hypothetical protein
MLNRKYYVEVWLKQITTIERLYSYLDYEMKETDLSEEEKAFRIMAIRNEIAERTGEI